MAGTVVADKWQNGDGTENYKCRAWVNFNGTGTVAILASGNVSSITDNGIGDYTVNFTTAMPDMNYSVISSSIMYDASTVNYAIGVKSGGVGGVPTLQTTTQVRLLAQEGQGANFDTNVYVAIFR